MFIVSGVICFLFLIWGLWLFPVFAKLDGKTGQLVKHALIYRNRWENKNHQF